MKHWRLSFAALFAGLFITEVSLGTLYALDIGQWNSATKLTKLFYERPAHKDQTLQGCKNVGELWSPSPVFAYVRSGACPQSLVKSNRNGFIGEEAPIHNDPKVFHVLLTGGSVAERMGLLKEGNLPYFEAKLNQLFTPPTGDRFKIVVAAMADYRLPQQISAAMFHQQVIDGWVDLSGYNELRNYGHGRRLEFPSTLYQRAITAGAMALHAQEIENLRLRILQSFWRHSFTGLKIMSYNFYHKVQDLQSSGRAWQPKTLKFPESVSEKEQLEINLRQHQGYLRLMNSHCKTLGWSCAFFLQPIPQCDKPLHAEEKFRLGGNEQKLCSIYKEIEKNLLSTGPVHSLRSLFSNSHEIIYEDDCHMADPHPLEAGTGSKKMVDTIIRLIGTSWNLKPR